MDDKTNRPQRRSVRLPGYNYAGPGTIFVTICTDRQQMLFGKVSDGTMHRNDIGEIAFRQWQSTFTMRTDLIDHGSIVMPNHMHAMFTLDPATWGSDDTPALAHRVSKSVGEIVGGYKSAVTSGIRRTLNDPEAVVWQRGFHDVIVRTSDRYNAIAQYIVENPARWAEDKYRNEVP